MTREGGKRTSRTRTTPTGSDSRAPAAFIPAVVPAPAPQTSEDLEKQALELADPRWVISQVLDVLENLKRSMKTAKEVTPAGVQKYLSILRMGQEWAAKLTENLKGPLERLADPKWLSLQEEMIGKCEAAVAQAHELEQGQKKKILALLSRLRELQRKARTGPLAAFAYYGRDPETSNFLMMDHLQAEMMAALTSTSEGVIIEAPTGHSKSQIFTGAALWEVQEDTKLRFLIVVDAKKKITTILQVLYRYIGGSDSGPYRALFPHVEVDRESQVTLERFNVVRPNRTSREYTFQGTVPPYESVQGDGYDRLYLDDPCPPGVRRFVYIREAINTGFTSVLWKRLRNDRNRRLRYVCTPWHIDDLRGKLEAEVAAGLRPDWQVLKFPVLDDEHGKAISLWPSRYSSDYYEAAKRTDPDYDLMFRLNPSASATQIIKRIAFYPYSRQDPMWDAMGAVARERWAYVLKAAENGEQWLSIDPAYTRSRSASRNWVTQISMSAQGFAFVRDAWDLDGGAEVTRLWILRKIAGDAVFASRYCAPEEDDDAKAIKRTMARNKVLAAGGIHHILIETGASQTGAIDQYELYIRNTLADMGVIWNGGIHKCKPHARGSNALVSKNERLRSVAYAVDEGRIRFAGKIKHVGTSGYPILVSVDNETMKKLVVMLMNAGAMAGATNSGDAQDTISQWLIWMEARLRRVDLSAAKPSAISAERKFVDPLNAARKALYDAAMKPKQEPDELERTFEWMASQVA